MDELTREYLATAVNAMRARGIDFPPGLTGREIERAQSAHGFRFPPDLRMFLECALPVGERFPDWREPKSNFMLDRLAWPADGMCFDIEHNAFWLPEWGSRPRSLAVAQARAREAVGAAPFLVPVYGHRYLPAAPCEPGNPIFSVYQTDIIFYGLDLPSYLFAEFNVPNPYPVPEAPRDIEFWTQFCG